jgi:hypothetical protein
MPTYDLAFARKFAEVAEATVARGLDDVEAHRVVAYISRLSMELSLKAFLERVGLPVDQIRKHWHDLRSLLAEVEACEVEIETSSGAKRWMPASRIRSVDVGFQGHSATLGLVLEAEDHGASKYPNELRYGDSPKDFPAAALARAAMVLAEWVAEHSDAARRL